MPDRQAPTVDQLTHPLPTRPLVAVLPFQAAGDDPALRLLGNEVADLLRERLAGDPAVQAILISSDFLAKAPPHAVELVCRELRVGYLVSGKCHGGSGSQPSLYMELTETRDWHVRWANFYPDPRSLLAADSAPMDDLVAVLRRTLVQRPPR